MKTRITASTIKRAEPCAKPYELVDDLVRGFLARVQPSGKISYYYAYRTSDGTRKRTRIGTHPTITPTIARKAAESLAADVTQGRDPQLEKKRARVAKEIAKSETLGGFIEHKYQDWVESHQRRGDETIRLLKRDFSHLLSKKISNISAWDVQKWRTEKGKDGLAVSTINRRVTTLKAALNRAVEWDVVAVNPLNKVKPLKLDRKQRVRYLSSQEETSLRKALDDREEEIRQSRESGNIWRKERNYTVLPSVCAPFVDHLKPMVLLALNTGLRRGEVFNLRWCDVDLEKPQVIIEGETSKSGQTRHIPLNSEALSLLSVWKNQSEGEFVFQNPKTGRKFDNIKRSWTSIRNSAGIRDFRFHDLRHTFASKLVMAGESLYTIKELLGHSTVQVTERYAHLAPEHKASAVEKLVSTKIS